MSAEEIPLVFGCEGSSLIGIAHRPTKPKSRGILAIVAGGPQYRGGCCRQLVQMARALSAEGYPVMRFDYRGMGDSSGVFLGFQHIEADLRAALAAFKQAVPELQEVVLWGGCDAASASLIHGYKFPIVTGMILGNPYAHSAETEVAVARKYYLQRLRDKTFWARVFKLRFNPIPVARSVLASVLGKSQRKAKASHGAMANDLPFTERMLLGLKQFRGSILLLMSGLSLTSQEFDVLVSRSPAWRKALQGCPLERVEIADADQAFSTIESRDRMIVAALDWLSRKEPAT